jgi:hypothetical protein
MQRQLLLVVFNKSPRPSRLILTKVLIYEKH